MKVIAALLLGLIVIFGATVFYGMGVYNNNGDMNPMYGKKHTEKTLLKMK